jgi:group I intron endonuclease
MNFFSIIIVNPNNPIIMNLDLSFLKDTSLYKNNLCYPIKLNNLNVQLDNNFDKDKGYIYCITNIKNKLKYIGQTKCYKKINGKFANKNPEDRFKQHLTKAFNKKTMNDCQKFYTAIREYGKELFYFEILEKCLLNDINKREKYYIRKYNTKKNGYNISRGGKKKSSSYKKNKSRYKKSNYR